MTKAKQVLAIFAASFAAWMFSQLKAPAATLMVAALLVVGLLTGERLPFFAKAFLRRLVLSFFVAVLAFVAAYGFFIWLAPAVTSDGHHVMPIGQAGGGLIVATGVGLGAFFRFYRGAPILSPLEERRFMTALTIGAIIGWAFVARSEYF